MRVRAILIGVLLATGAGEAPAQTTWREPVQLPPAVGLPPPEGLEPAAGPTLEAIFAARGNLLRWRDAERARIGPSRRDNIAANAKAQAEFWAKLRTLPLKERRKLAMPDKLDEGATLPVVTGTFAYFLETPEGTAVRIASGSWADILSNAGEPSIISLSPRGDCTAIEADIADVAFLGGLEADPTYTPLAMSLRPPSSGAPVLTSYDVLWLTPPTTAVLQRTFPQRALQREQAGKAKLRCAIAGERLDCQAVDETPAGWGFGEAAMKASQMIAVAPTLKDGTPSSGRELCFAIRYALE